MKNWKKKIALGLSCAMLTCIAPSISKNGIDFKSREVRAIPPEYSIIKPTKVIRTSQGRQELDYSTRESRSRSIPWDSSGYEEGFNGYLWFQGRNSGERTVIDPKGEVAVEGATRNKILGMSRYKGQTYRVNMSIGSRDKDGSDGSYEWYADIYGGGYKVASNVDYGRFCAWIDSSTGFWNTNQSNPLDYLSAKVNILYPSGRPLVIYEGKVTDCVSGAVVNNKFPDKFKITEFNSDSNRPHIYFGPKIMIFNDKSKSEIYRYTYDGDKFEYELIGTYPDSYDRMIYPSYSNENSNYVWYTYSMNEWVVVDKRTKTSKKFTGKSRSFIYDVKDSGIEHFRYNNGLLERYRGDTLLDDAQASLYDSYDFMNKVYQNPNISGSGRNFSISTMAYPDGTWWRGFMAVYGNVDGIDKADTEKSVIQSNSAGTIDFKTLYTADEAKEILVQLSDNKAVLDILETPDKISTGWQAARDIKFENLKPNKPYYLKYAVRSDGSVSSWSEVKEILCMQDNRVSATATCDMQNLILNFGIGFNNVFPDWYKIKIVEKGKDLTSPDMGTIFTDTGEFKRQGVENISSQRLKISGLDLMKEHDIYIIETGNIKYNVVNKTGAVKILTTEANFTTATPEDILEYINRTADIDEICKKLGVVDKAKLKVTYDKYMTKYNNIQKAGILYVKTLGVDDELYLETGKEPIAEYVKLPDGNYIRFANSSLKTFKKTNFTPPTSGDLIIK